MPGFGEILKQLDNAYHFRKNEINSTTAEFMSSLEDTSKNILINKDLEIDKSVLDESAINLSHISDFTYGGFGLL